MKIQNLLSSHLLNLFFSSCPCPSVVLLCFSSMQYSGKCAGSNHLFLGIFQQAVTVFVSSSLSDKDYGLIAMNQDTVFYMPGHSTCKHNPLNMSANTPQVIHIVAMTDPVNILLDDWSGIQFLCYIMCRRSDYKKQKVLHSISCSQSFI